MATSYFLHTIGIAAVLYADANYWKQPYHTSALSGEAWVNELIHGHPDRIFTELGMRLHVFMSFVAHLQIHGGLTVSKHGVSVEEQAAIFLYTCVTGLSVRHVGERFQRSNETISKWVFIVYLTFSLSSNCQIFSFGSRHSFFWQLLQHICQAT